MEDFNLKIQLDNWKKKHFILYFVMCVVLVIVGVSIGFMGPPVFDSREMHFDTTNQTTIEKYVVITDLNRFHQFMSSTFHFKNSGNEKLNFNANVTVDVVGCFDYSSQFSDWGNVTESSHERQITCNPNSNCTTHLIAWEPYLNYKNYKIDFVIKVQDFYAGLKDLYVNRKEERKFKSFYLPKLVVCLFVWLLVFILYLWNQIEEIEDPQNESIRDIRGYATLEIILIILALSLFLWVCVSCCLGFKKIKSIPEQKKRFKFFFSWFVFAFVFSVIIVCGRFLSKLKNTSGEFMAMFTIFNVYILSYGYAILPEKNMIKNIDGGSHTKLDEEESSLDEILENNSETDSNVEMEENFDDDDEDDDDEDEENDQDEEKDEDEENDEEMKEKTSDSEK
ncbi:transmembrane protein [Anaeramoeba flamelloides]|uniref:Transmembrane protein n=1 Tax=Anaeramoeba flamelloides TaxID=1746091 RepID=A0AAV7YE12_9EUKA|nr:transmembrane protein [Anaeramoeba flamelloides]